MYTLSGQVRLLHDPGHAHTHAPVVLRNSGFHQNTVSTGLKWSPQFLPKNREAIMAKRTLYSILSLIPDANWMKLDREIDYEHRDARGQIIPQHLGRIAESMINWEGVIADHLTLSEPDRSDIKEKNLNKPSLQRWIIASLIMPRFFWQEIQVNKLMVNPISI